MKFPFLLFPSQTLWGLRLRKGDLIPPWVSGSVNSHLNNRGANAASTLGHIPAQISKPGKGPAEESPCLVSPTGPGRGEQGAFSLSFPTGRAC